MSHVLASEGAVFQLMRSWRANRTSLTSL